MGSDHEERPVDDGLICGRETTQGPCRWERGHSALFKPRGQRVESLGPSCTDDGQPHELQVPAFSPWLALLVAEVEHDDPGREPPADRR